MARNLSASLCPTQRLEKNLTVLTNRVDRRCSMDQFGRFFCLFDQSSSVSRQNGAISQISNWGTFSLNFRVCKSLASAISVTKIWVNAEIVDQVCLAISSRLEIWPHSNCLLIGEDHNCNKTLYSRLIDRTIRLSWFFGWFERCLERSQSLIMSS